jgi:hypothetical protein
VGNRKGIREGVHVSEGSFESRGLIKFEGAVSTASSSKPGNPEDPICTMAISVTGRPGAGGSLL